MKFKLFSKDMLGKKSLSIIAEVNEKSTDKKQSKVDEYIMRDYGSVPGE